MHEGIHCQQRKKVRCFILVRHPVERFLSYYQERTAAAPEHRPVPRDKLRFRQLRSLGHGLDILGPTTPVHGKTVNSYLFLDLKFTFFLSFFPALRTCALLRVWAEGLHARALGNDPALKTAVFKWSPLCRIGSAGPRLECGSVAFLFEECGTRTLVVQW